MLKMTLVRTVAKRFILRHAAAADRNYCAALQAIFITLHVYYFEVPVNFNRTIAVYRQFCCCHAAKIVQKVNG